jgi:hypothetical protein
MSDERMWGLTLYLGTSVTEVDRQVVVTLDVIAGQPPLSGNQVGPRCQGAGGGKEAAGPGVLPKPWLLTDNDGN